MEPAIRITKIWEDIDFFELRFNFKTTACSMDINIYSNNEELNNLRQGIIGFSQSFDEFTWIAGEDKSDATHFLSLRHFKINNRGYVGVEVLADNKLDSHEKIKANFCIVTFVGQLDDLLRKLERLINGEVLEIEGLLPE